LLDARDHLLHKGRWVVTPRCSRRRSKPWSSGSRSASTAAWFACRCASSNGCFQSGPPRTVSRSLLPTADPVRGHCRTENPSAAVERWECRDQRAGLAVGPWDRADTRGSVSDQPLSCRSLQATATGRYAPKRAFPAPGCPMTARGDFGHDHLATGSISLTNTRWLRSRDTNVAPHARSLKRTPPRGRGGEPREH